MKRAKMLGVAGLMTAIALTVAGCGGTAEPEDPSGPAVVTGGGISEELIAAAQAEGSLTLYHGTTEETTRRWVDEFSREYGIDVIQLRDSSAPLSQRFVQESQAGHRIADLIIVTDPPWMHEATEQGLFAEHALADSGAFPAATTREGFVYPLYATFPTLTYSTERLSQEEIDLIEQEGVVALADPRFRGRISVISPHASFQYVAFYTALAEEYGWDWLEAVAANDPAIFDGIAAQLERLIAGEYALGLGIADPTSAQQYIAGAPIRWLYPATTPEVTWMMAIAENAPHPNAARLFMEWATTPEAISSFALYSQGLPSREDAVDGREFLDETWFQLPEDVWDDWSTDESLVDDRDAFLAQWDEVFDFAG